MNNRRLPNLFWFALPFSLYATGYSLYSFFKTTSDTLQPDAGMGVIALPFTPVLLILGVIAFALQYGLYRANRVAVILTMLIAPLAGLTLGAGLATMLKPLYAEAPLESFRSIFFPSLALVVGIMYALIAEIVGYRDLKRRPS